MDIIEILGVMANAVRDFFLSISYLDALCLVGIFIVTIFLLMASHIVFGTKASTTRRARAIARYFNNKYIGSSLDASKFLRKKKRLLNKPARVEFAMFINSTNNIKDTDFAREVMQRGRNSLNLVLPLFNIAIFVSGLFLLAMGLISMMFDVELALYVGIPVAIMLVIKAILYGMISIADKNYHKASRMLRKSLDSIRYNNEYIGNVYSNELDAKMDTSTENSKADEVVSKMLSIENTLDGDTQQMLRDSMEQVKDDLSEVDRLKYEEFLARYSEAE